MLYSLKLYFQDRLIALSLVISLAVVIVMWTITWRKVAPTSESLFLHYNVIFGVDLLGRWQRLMLPNYLGLTALIGNSTLSLLLFNHSRVISRLLAVFTVGVEVAVLVGQILIVNLNS